MIRKASGMSIRLLDSSTPQSDLFPCQAATPSPTFVVSPADGVACPIA